MPREKRSCSTPPDAERERDGQRQRIPPAAPCPPRARTRALSLSLSLSLALWLSRFRSLTHRRTLVDGALGAQLPPGGRGRGRRGGGAARPRRPGRASVPAAAPAGFFFIFLFLVGFFVCVRESSFLFNTRRAPPPVFLSSLPSSPPSFYWLPLSPRSLFLPSVKLKL